MTNTHSKVFLYNLNIMGVKNAKIGNGYNIHYYYCINMFVIQNSFLDFHCINFC